MTRTYSQSAPILAFLDHLTDAVNDIEDPQAGLEGVDRFVQVSRGLLALQESAFLLDQAVPNLGDTGIE